MLKKIWERIREADELETVKDVLISFGIPAMVAVITSVITVLLSTR